MIGLRIFFLLVVALLTGSVEQKSELMANTDDLTILKDNFLEKISSTSPDEGPFHFNYQCRTIFFSEKVISLFGELSVYDRLPHGWRQYEGKTFYKVNGLLEEVKLDHLFPTHQQKKSLIGLCENTLQYPLTYEDIQTFVVDDQHLILILDPYSIRRNTDEPTFVKIPWTQLIAVQEVAHPFYSILEQEIKAGDFISSWDIDTFYQNLASNFSP